MLVAVDDNIPLLADALAPCADVRAFTGRSLTKADLADVEVLFVRSTTKVNKSLLEGTSVRFVGTATSGVDHIDVEYLAERGIPWIEAAGCNAASVAEYVVYAALSHAHKQGKQLRGLSIGIVGFGHVGSRVGVLAHRLGMSICVSDPPLIGVRGALSGYCRTAELPELISTSDIVTVHVPFTTAGDYPTAGLLSAPYLSLMQPGALLIQASRGGVVDESALLPLLEAEQFEAAVDVWENEPVPDERLVQRCALATPHIAGHSFEGKLRGSAAMVATFVEWTGLEPDMELLDIAFDSALPTIPNYTDETQLIELLHDRRKLHEDDAFLRSLYTFAAEERGKRFDEFRSRYPIRRETFL